MTNFMKTYDCIFTGGASRGLCYTGVLKAFEELGIKINKHAGSSIGALMITFYALGFSASEIEEEADKLNMLSLFRDFNFNILSDFAFSKGNIFLSWLRRKIESKFYGSNYKQGKMPPVCFKDLDKELYICASNLEAGSIEVFSKETSPDAEIALALRAAAAMPALLTPVKYQGKILIDGDILRGRPIWKAVHFNKENLLEFRITGGQKNRYSKNPVKLINSIVNAAAYSIDNDAVLTYQNRHEMIQIDVKGTDFTDFKFTQKQKHEIYKTGYDAVIEHFR